LREVHPTVGLGELRGESNFGLDLLDRVEGVGVVLGEDGSVLAPDVMFAAPRREWDADAIEAAVKSVTGKKPPREKTRSVVVQSFTTRVVTTYVYEPPKAAKTAAVSTSIGPPPKIKTEAGNDSRSNTCSAVKATSASPGTVGTAGELPVAMMIFWA
jgi:hypothetical protein